MITKFKIFEKSKTFNIKDQNIIVNLTNNKIDDIDYIRSLNLSYYDLVDSGIWSHITNSQRKYAIGDTYSFIQPFGRIKHEEIKKCMGQEILCIDDKAGPFGGKPTVTEGKLYTLYGFNEEVNREKIKIKNDRDNFIQISPERFCKSDINVNTIKYNL